MGWYAPEKRVDLMRSLLISNTGFMGVVYGGQSGRPLSNVKVEALQHGTNIVVGSPVYTKPDGFFAVTGLTDQALYDFKFSKSNYTAVEYTNSGVGLRAQASYIPDLPVAVVLNQVVPSNQWSLMIVWNSWQPGYWDALTTWYGKPSWYPFNWYDSAGTYFTAQLKLPDGSKLSANNPGNRVTFPYAAMTHDPWFTDIDTGANSAAPAANFVISQVQAGEDPYKLYCNLNNGADPDNFYQWGSYGRSKAVAYLYKGRALQAKGGYPLPPSSVQPTTGGISPASTAGPIPRPYGISCRMRSHRKRSAIRISVCSKARRSSIPLHPYSVRSEPIEAPRSKAAGNLQMQGYCFLLWFAR
jgi:hypothetical protein